MTDRERTVVQLLGEGCTVEEIKNFRIDPGDGRVTGVVDASSLLSPEERGALPEGAVLNGIAWIPERESFVLTGKLWPALFEVRLR